MPQRRRGCIKGIGKAKKIDFYRIPTARFEEFASKHPLEAIDFCHSQSRDAGRQSDSEMTKYWQERAKQIREKYLQ
jgi:hypothetical protein